MGQKEVCVLTYIKRENVVIKCLSQCPKIQKQRSSFTAVRFYNVTVNTGLPSAQPLLLEKRED